MKLVADANVIFAILIKEGKTEEIFFDDGIIIFVPELMFEEFRRHRQLILRKTGRDARGFQAVLDEIMGKSNIVPDSEIKDCLPEARKLSPDKNDIDYFALAIKLDCPIWSNDNLLKKQHKIKVLSTKDLLFSLNL